MTHVDLEDRAESGEGKAYLAVIEALHDQLGSHCPAELLGDAADRICDALEELGQQQEDPARARADMEEWQRQAEQIVADVRARRVGQP